jgi:hypothetical protein
MNHGCVQLQANTKAVSPELTLFTTESADSPSLLDECCARLVLRLLSPEAGG